MTEDGQEIVFDPLGMTLNPHSFAGEIGVLSRLFEQACESEAAHYATVDNLLAVGMVDASASIRALAAETRCKMTDNLQFTAWKLASNRRMTAPPDARWLIVRPVSR